MSRPRALGLIMPGVILLGCWNSELSDRHDDGASEPLDTLAIASHVELKELFVDFAEPHKIPLEVAAWAISPDQRTIVILGIDPTGAPRLAVKPVNDLRLSPPLTEATARTFPLHARLPDWIALAAPDEAVLHRNGDPSLMVVGLGDGEQRTIPFAKELVNDWGETLLKPVGLVNGSTLLATNPETSHSGEPGLVWVNGELVRLRIGDTVTVVDVLMTIELKQLFWSPSISLEIALGAETLIGVGE